MRLVTMVDEAYAPGLAVLLQSLRERAALPDLAFTALTTAPLTAGTTAALEACGVPIEWVPTAELGTVRPKPHIRGQYRTALQKLLVFNLPGDDPMAFLDADLLCLGSLQGIETLPPFTVALDRGLTEPHAVHDRPMFNTGFFVFRPDRERAAELLDYYEWSDEPFPLGDQSVLNSYFYSRYPDEVHVVEPTWNTLKRRAAVDEAFDVEGVRLLHFTSRKPWEAVWHPEGPYGPRLLALDRLWWDCYDRSPASTKLALRRPPFSAMAWTHSTAAWRFWRVAKWAWERLPRSERRVLASTAPPR